MKYAITSLTTLLTLAGSTVAQLLNQSQPFTLVLLSQDDNNGTTLELCHIGVAAEILCADAPPGSAYQQPTFYFNTSCNDLLQNSGSLIYELAADLDGTDGNTSETMSLYSSSIANTGTLLFTPGDDDATLVSFDSDNKMELFLDDDVVSSLSTDQSLTGYYRWYLCDPTDIPYSGLTLNFAVGKFPLDNPNCDKVDVVRQFVQG